MTHRTTNPKTAFYGDMRETSAPSSPRKHNKYNEAEAAYRQEFGIEIPCYYGAAFDAYRKLQDAGWKWSTRRGWEN